MFSTDGEVSGRKRQSRASSSVFPSCTHQLCSGQLGAGPRPQHMRREKAVPVGKDHCPSHDTPAHPSEERPGRQYLVLCRAKPISTRLALTHRPLLFPLSSFCLPVQFNPFQHWSFPVSLSLPTALEPRISQPSTPGCPLPKSCEAERTTRDFPQGEIQRQRRGLQGEYRAGVAGCERAEGAALPAVAPTAFSLVQPSHVDGTWCRGRYHQRCILTPLPSTICSTNPAPASEEVHRAVHPPAALGLWAYAAALRCAVRCLHPACPSARCRASCVQTADFQHTSFSCKPASTSHKLPSAFTAMLAGLPG